MGAVPREQQEGSKERQKNKNNPSPFGQAAPRNINSLSLLASSSLEKAQRQVALKIAGSGKLAARLGTATTGATQVVEIIGIQREPGTGQKKCLLRLIPQNSSQVFLLTNLYEYCSIALWNLT